METPAATDSGDEMWTTVIPESSAQYPAEQDFLPQQLSPNINEFDTIIIESNSTGFRDPWSLVLLNYFSTKESTHRFQP